MFALPLSGAGSATERQEAGWMSASLLALTLSSCAAGRSLSKPQITTASPATADEIRAVQEEKILECS